MRSIIAAAGPLLNAAIAAEAFVSAVVRRDGKYRLRDTAASLVLGLGNLIADGLWIVPAYAVYRFAHRFAPTTFVSSLPAWAALFFLDDLAFYAFHRASHRVRIFWAAHIVHHSSERLNLGTGARQSWTAGLLGWLFWAPLALVGFPPFMVLTMQGLNLLYQFFLHTEYVGGLGPLEWVLNTPRHHRVHHGKGLAFADSNFGGVLIIWDRLFGTFSDERPAEYGLARPIGSDNPVRIAFAEYGALGRDLARARSWRERARAVFAGPRRARISGGSPVRRAAPSRGGLLCALLVLSALPFAFAALGALWVRSAVAKSVAAREEVRTLRGVVEERGVLPGRPEIAVVSRVSFDAPDRFRAEVLAPDELAGDVLALARGELVLFSRARNVAVRVRNVPALDDLGRRRLLEERGALDALRYDYDEGPADSICGRRVLEWTARPRAPSAGAAALAAEAHVWLEPERPAWPLRIAIANPWGGPAYSLRFLSISAGGADASTEPPSAGEPPDAIPDSASVVELDLARPPLELAAAEAAADFHLLEPADTPLGLVRTRIVRARGRYPPVFTFVFERAPFLVTVTEIADHGSPGVIERGMPVTIGGAAGRLAFFGDLAMVDLHRAGVRVTLLGNVPYPELLRMAASLEPAATRRQR
jgi:sterol desaturase/sphingolipid hydroxylase (fatty acid hydroxylase superfamily)